MNCGNGSQRPTWASKGKVTSTEQRQRIIVFIAGGATYSESRSCYEIAQKFNRDVILGSTDMLTPASFIRELSRAREPRKNLNLCMDQMRTPPAHQMQPYHSTPFPQDRLPPRPSAGRMGPPQAIPQPGRSGADHGSRNGAVGGPRPLPGESRPPMNQRAQSPGHGVLPGTSNEPSTGKDSKDGDKKKKKKFGMF